MSSPPKSRSTSPTKGFGSTAPRFDVHGTHPRTRHAFRCLPTVYSPREDDMRRGPGCYDVKSVDFESPPTEHGWENEFDPSRTFGLPTLRQTHRQWNEEEARKHGPGTYGVPDYNPKSSSFHFRYLVQDGPRMAPENKHLAAVPGPGTYVSTSPKSRESPTKLGIMASTGRDFRRAISDSGLSPAQYDMEKYTSVSKVLDRKVGLYGPIDAYTGTRIDDRDTKNPPIIPPGLYDVPPPKVSPYKYRVFDNNKTPSFPTDRLTISTLAQRPRPLDEPSIGDYEPKPVLSRSYNHLDNFAFGIKSQRDAQIPGNAFLLNKGTVDPGRYNLVAKPVKKSEKNHGVLGSKVPRFGTLAQSEAYERERLRPKYMGPLDLAL